MSSNTVDNPFFARVWTVLSAHETDAVLCSVDEPDGVLRQLLSLLRPGGELRYLEHIASSGPRARLQKFADATIWPRLLGNCHTHRHTEESIVGAGFQVSGAPARMDVSGVGAAPGRRVRNRSGGQTGGLAVSTPSSPSLSLPCPLTRAFPRQLQVRVDVGHRDQYPSMRKIFLGSGGGPSRGARAAVAAVPAVQWPRSRARSPWRYATAGWVRD